MEASRKNRFTAWTALALSAAALSLVTACEDDPAIAPDRTEPIERAENVPAPETPEAPGAAENESASRDEPSGSENASDETASRDEPAKSDEPENQDEGTADSSGLEIKRLVVTHDVKDREPVEGDELKADSGPIYAFVEMVNEAADKSGIVITFEHESGTKVGHVELDVPGDQPRWRTWGQTKMIRKAGRWDAVIHGADGKELGRESFEVAPKA